MAADQTFENYRKPTRRDEFLKTMEAIVPWAALCEVIEPHYPKVGNGRPPIGLERMLRIHFIQHWFNQRGSIPRPLGRYLGAMRSEPCGCPHLAV